ncbi:MAG: lipid A deacylase LpxR family protein [Verrucomicrobiae bacterium]|nr:lipid A deacylase LpxR family protein [Verrucomicrobiae bacterium]NNJ41759.1 lipid A deacylase LpxR family protein [Akkermansiaceae bacterium]
MPLVIAPQRGLTGGKEAEAPVGVVRGDAVANDAGYLTFFLDNDLFVGTDANYTNGARISYITEGKPVIDIPLIQKYLHSLSGDGGSASWLQKIGDLGKAQDVEYSYGFALTQMMFTPTTRTSLTPPAGERPYAGWLGLGLSLHARNAHALNSVEISLGMVGPHAYAKEAQDLIHDIRGFDKFQGWGSQIPDEFTLNVNFNHRRRWSALSDIELPMHLEIDGFHETGYALGNYLTAAHAGLMIRVGWNLPVEFSDPRLSTSAHTQKLYSDASVNSTRWSIYALAGIRVGGILHDVTLDGPVFRNFDTGVEKEPWVGEIYAGFGVRYQNWEFGYVHTYRSKRFETQEKEHSFGSIAIRTRF